MLQVVRKLFGLGQHTPPKPVNTGAYTITGSSYDRKSNKTTVTIQTFDGKTVSIQLDELKQPPFELL